MAECVAGHTDSAFELRYIEPGTPEYAEAAEVRYEALYRDLGLGRELIADTDGRTYHHLAAFADGRVIGFARIHLERGESRIFQVSVTRRWRRHGVATAMVRELMRLARAEGRTEVTLDARVEAIALYEKLGFVVDGEEFLSPRTGTPHRPMRVPL